MLCLKYSANSLIFSSPIIIHCLTGAARSATLVALDICLKKLDDTANRPCGPLADVEDVVMRIRTQRAMAVQVGERHLKLSYLSNYTGGTS